MNPNAFRRRCRQWLLALHSALIVSTLLVNAVQAGDVGPPRLQLQVRAPIGNTNGSQCSLTAEQAQHLSQQPDPSDLILTERDVVSWQPDNGHWTLSPARIANRWQLEDRCFILTIDDPDHPNNPNNRVRLSGVVLSSNTARLTGIATLYVGVNPRDKNIDVRLTSGNQGGQTRLLLRDQLHAVFGANFSGNIGNNASQP